MKEIYKKFNSFVGLRIKNKFNIQNFLDNLHLHLNDKKNSLNLSQNEIQILEYIKKDLFESGTKKRPKFKLTPNVVKEIESLNFVDIPRYLVHRYRYEIYPQLKIFDDFPPYLQIEPTSICNYRCIFCYQTDNEFNKRSTGFMGHMKLETFKLLVDQAEGNIEFISLASRGEPLLCPDIKEMLAYTRDKFLNLKINTNASLLDEQISHSILTSGVKTLVFSADAADENLYSKLRVNGKLDKILANIKQFQEIRIKNYPKSKIITRVSGVKISNQQNLDDMEKFWGSFVDQVAFVDYVPWENVYQSKYSGIQTPCSDLWRRMFVWWDGKVNPCDVDYKSELSSGDIKNHNISELWKSNNYINLRKKHIENLRTTVSPCNKCVVV
jgi:radical SAM protein with 4Fe4S-binding SPASM domain|tara:strand:- start:608 stop:1756 length:1149 start_codon:yes stop_codon:yes gene_type:complete